MRGYNKSITGREKGPEGEGRGERGCRLRKACSQSGPWGQGVPAPPVKPQSCPILKQGGDFSYHLMYYFTGQTRVCLAGRVLGVSTQTPPGKMAPVSQGHFFGEGPTGGHSSNYAAGGQYPPTKRSWARHQYHPHTGLPRLCRLFQKPMSHLSSLTEVST